MVDVKKPDLVWHIVVPFNSDECPYLFWPANLTGCKKLSTQVETVECDITVCPFVGEEIEQM